MCRLGPRTVGQLLDGGFDVLRFRFTRIATLTAVLLLPFVAVPAVAAYLSGAGSSGLGAIFTDTTPSDPVAAPLALTGIVLAYVGSFLAMVAEMVMGVAVAHMVGSWLAGSDPTARQALGFVRTRTVTLLGAFMLAFMVKALGAVPCGIGLVILVPMLSLLAPVVAVEGSPASASFSRAFALGKRRWGPLLGITCLWLIIRLLLSLAQLGIQSVLSAFVPSGAAFDIVSLSISISMTTFLTVVSVAVSVLAYFDARIRTEGFDLAMTIPTVFASPAGTAGSHSRV